MKQKINISISEDTAERLKMYAWENHKTVSQAITDWIWTAKVTGSWSDIASRYDEEVGTGCCGALPRAASKQILM